jgi:hypothetical protein
MTSSVTWAVPCTSTWGSAGPALPVGSENSSATRGSRRTLNAFCGKPMDVPRSTELPSSAVRTVVGQAIGTPLRPTVANSAVR